MHSMTREPYWKNVALYCLTTVQFTLASGLPMISRCDKGLEFKSGQDKLLIEVTGKEIFQTAPVC
jgi:hypothetical protein